MEVTLEDIHFAAPWKLILFLSATTILYLLISFSMGVNALSFIAIAIGLFVVFIIFRSFTAKGRIKKKMPGLLGKRSGFVSARRLLVQQPFQESEYLMSALVDFKIRKDTMFLNFSANRLVSIVLPKRGFVEEGGAKQAFNIVERCFARNKFVPKTLFDARITDCEPDYPGANSS